mmetsp:Transcript_9817/g.25800  ORF Transcript_9817/g.25800 Transcript_9817/m.25800 type:complete len:90 (-) Transcript_9817:1118-1387(-)
MAVSLWRGETRAPSEFREPGEPNIRKLAEAEGGATCCGDVAAATTVMRRGGEAAPFPTWCGEFAVESGVPTSAVSSPGIRKVPVAATNA